MDGDNSENDGWRCETIDKDDSEGEMMMMRKCEVAMRSMKVRICRVVDNQLIDSKERIKRDGKSQGFLGGASG